MRQPHQEIERGNARKILRCQGLTEERNALLAKRKLARAKASEQTIFRIDEAPQASRFWWNASGCMEGGQFPEYVLASILASTEYKDFTLAKKTCAPANSPPGKAAATANSSGCSGGTVYAEHPIFKPNPDDEPPKDRGDVPHPNVALTRWFAQSSFMCGRRRQDGQPMHGILQDPPGLL